MTDTKPTTDERIGHNSAMITPEASPSKGAEGTTTDLHAVYGLGDRGKIITVENDEYLKDVLGVSS